MEFKYNNRNRQNRKNKRKGHHHDDRWENSYDLDVDMSGDIRGQSERRYNPYMNHHQRHKNKQKGRHSGDDASQWYKVNVNFTQELEKSFIIRSISNLCDTVFAPVNFNQMETRCIFYVQGSKVSQQIRQCNNRITKPDGKKLAIQVESVSGIPPINLTTKQVEELKLYMSANYNTATRTLTLSGVHNDPELKEKSLFISLEDKNVIAKVVDIITEHIPELESLGLQNNNIYQLAELERLAMECPNLISINLSRNKIRKPNQLDPLKGLELKDLTLENTMLAMNFRSKWDQYVSTIRGIFPTLTKLDGKDIPPPIGFETGEELPQCRPSYFLMDDVQPLVVDFVKRFYTVLDVGDRETLSQEYHSQAMFSLSVPRISTRAHVPQVYHAENRNFHILSERVARTKLLRQGLENVIKTLSCLPKTVHHPATFLVDVNHVSAQLMTFNICGLFNIVTDKPGNRILAFNRSLAVIPTPEVPGRFSIINDMLSIAPATVAQARALKRTTMALPPPVSSIEQPVKEQLVLQLSQHTKMNIPFSTQCLQESNWNLEIAMANFTQAKAAGAIPPEAFVV